jgi:hypothetical protein
VALSSSALGDLARVNWRAVDGTALLALVPDQHVLAVGVEEQDTQV